MKLLLVVLLTVSCPILTHAQQATILTKDSAHYTGRLLSGSADTIALALSGGGMLRLPRASIARIDTGAASEGDLAATLPDDDRGPDEIELRAGQEYSGRVTKERADSVNFWTEDGHVMQFPRSDIATLRYGTHRMGNFMEVGGVFGTPAGLNLVLGFEGSYVGFRASGMYLGNLSGLQLGIPFRISRTDRSSKYISVIFGTINIRTTETQTTYDFFGSPYSQTVDVEHYFSGVGVAYESNANGFFWEGGLMVGQGTFSNPQLMFQIGYVFEARSR